MFSSYLDISAVSLNMSWIHCCIITMCRVVYLMPVFL